MAKEKRESSEAEFKNPEKKKVNEPQKPTIPADLNNIFENTSIDQFEDKVLTKEAFALIKLKIKDYIIDLIDDSRKNSIRNNDEAIMVSHVNKASSNLSRGRRSITSQLIGTIGGIFLGATVSNILNIILNDAIIGATSLIIITLLTILGSFFVAISLIKR